MILDSVSDNMPMRPASEMRKMIKLLRPVLAAKTGGLKVTIRLNDDPVPQLGDDLADIAEAGKDEVTINVQEFVLSVLNEITAATIWTTVDWRLKFAWTLAHEYWHSYQMSSGRIKLGEDTVEWLGKSYPYESIDGISRDYKDAPWEDEASEFADKLITELRTTQ